ncbi:MAG: hypothetical protein Q7S22_06230 [Candidatus Micrarchaeota archaeon]|nr:hypothetical protein [Candidatus Micrarchaeota archaeon]
MRHARISGVASVQPRTSVSPLAEGLAGRFKTEVLDGKTFVIPLDGHENRNWAKLNNDGVVEYAKAHCAEKGITKLYELKKADSSLYQTLGKRKTPDGKNLLVQVFERKDFEEITLSGRTFQIISNPEGDRNWKAMPDDEMVAYAKAYIAEKGIKKISELEKGPNKDRGLGAQLQKRKLIGQVFKRKQFDEITLDGKKFKIPLNGHGYRNWVKMTNNEIVDYAKAYVTEKGIKKISELQTGQNKNHGLYSQLQRRKLIDRIFERKLFEEVILGDHVFQIPLTITGKNGNRNWIAMSDDEIIVYTKAYIAGKKITRHIELQQGPNKDAGLCHQLYKRKLMDRVFLEIKADQEASAILALETALENF